MVSRYSIAPGAFPGLESPRYRAKIPGIQSVKFYATPYSSNSEKVHFFLHELGINYDYQLIDLRRGEQHTADFQAINDHQRVPAIDWHGFKLFESQAILRYVAGKFDRLDWYPAQLEARARIDAMMDWINIHIGANLTAYTWESFFVHRLGLASNRERMIFAEKRLPRELQALERNLEKNIYMVGATPTLADVCLLPILSVAPLAGYDLTPYPRTWRWYELMTARPAWQAVLDRRKSSDIL